MSGKSLEDMTDEEIMNYGHDLTDASYAFANSAQAENSSIPEALAEAETNEADEANAGEEEVPVAGSEADVAEEDAAEDSADGSKEGQAPEAGALEGASPAPERKSGTLHAKGTLEAQLANASSAKNHTTPKHTAPEAEAAAAAEPTAGTEANAPAEQPANYEALYKQIMAPFKANGREFAPSSPEEAVRLMQMGANYTKKMQGLAPNLKLMRMLENNDLLAEHKISFLIDLDKKDPKAIQKLLHEGKVDTLSIDTEATPEYKPGNHTITDESMAFHDAIDAASATASGRETMKVINEEWDQASKQAIYQEPQLLSVLETQRSNGIYAKISGEIERRRILGQLANVPFIQAYKTVGDELHAAGKLVVADLTGSQQAAQGHAQQLPQEANVQSAPPKVVGTRSTRSSSQAATREQVRAISSAPGMSTKPAKASFNPFTMTDEEIMALPL